MQKYKYCPKCSQPLEDNGKCPGCSYGHKKHSPQADPSSKQCAFLDTGYRCQSDGHLSTDTHGAGPWYCRPHFSRIMGWPALEAGSIRDETQADVDARVNKIIPILTGESEHDWSTRCKARTLATLKHLGMPSPESHPEPGWNG